MSKINLALVGCGTVGGGVIKILSQNRDLINERLGLNLNLKYVVDLNRPGILDDYPLAGVTFTQDVELVMSDDEVDLVIHLIGGDTLERKFILRSLESGKHVVTANKALLAKHGPQIFQAALQNNLQVGFEASVAGGIPVLKVLREGLAANRIMSIYGIINGTANYILTSMRDQGQSFDEALALAQQQGFAEADPAFDIEGVDSAHKITILSELAYGGLVDLDEVYTEGITRISLNDLNYAAEFGYEIKLLGIARMEQDKLDVRVHPSMIRDTHLLAKVNGVYNAVYIDGDMVGPTIYYGQGAGREPTASAVMADVIEIAQGLRSGGVNSNQILNYFSQQHLSLLDAESVQTCYYIRFMTIDQPGVLAQISGILGQHGISISAVTQKERHAGDIVPIILLTHLALEHEMNAALREIEALEVVQEPPLKIRIINELSGEEKS